MIEATIHLYQFDELQDAAQARAILEHRAFLLDTLQPDYIDGRLDWDNPEKVAMYNAEYNDIEANDEPVIDSLRANEYYFFFDGTLCPTTHYVAGPRAGKIYIEIHGETDVYCLGENV